MKHLYQPRLGVSNPSDLVDVMSDATHPAHSMYMAMYNGSLPGHERWKKMTVLSSGNTFLMPQVGYMDQRVLERAEINWRLGVVCTNKFAPTWQSFLRPFEAELRAAKADHLLNSSLHINHNRHIGEHKSTARDTRKAPGPAEQPQARAAARAGPSSSLSPSSRNAAVAGSADHAHGAGGNDRNEHTGGRAGMYGGAGMHTNGYRDEAQRRYVRECLFPEDYALWRQICMH